MFKMPNVITSGFPGITTNEPRPVYPTSMPAPRLGPAAMRKKAEAIDAYFKKNGYPFSAFGPK